MSDIISNIVNDKQDVKNQLGDLPQVFPVLKTFYETIEPKEVVTKQVKKTFDGSSNVFILNSAEYGVLGTNKLGDSASSEELYSVIPLNLTYVEYFGQTDYISPNSTGTIDTSNETYTLNNDTLESEVIAKLREPITNVTILSHPDLVDTGTGMILPLTLGVSTFSDDNVAIEVSNDSGVTWYSTNEGEKFEFPTTSNNDELKYKISGVVTISSPIYVQINQ